jgi:hypothetical protein
MFDRRPIVIDNSGYEVSLERRKIYVALPDARAGKLGQLRVIDESGEGYRNRPDADRAAQRDSGLTL